MIRSKYEYVGPRNAPMSGAQWDDETDYPGIRATVALPGDCDEELLPELISPAHRCAGEQLDVHWGTLSVRDGRYRIKQKIFRAPTLFEAEAEARMWVAEAEATIAAVIAARAERMRRRAETIARAHAEVGTVAPPTSPEPEPEGEQ